MFIAQCIRRVKVSSITLWGINVTKMAVKHLNMVWSIQISNWTFLILQDVNNHIWSHIECAWKIEIYHREKLFSFSINFAFYFFCSINDKLHRFSCTFKVTSIMIVMIMKCQKSSIRDLYRLYQVQMLDCHFGYINAPKCKATLSLILAYKMLK